MSSTLPPDTSGVAKPHCEHHWTFHIRGGEPLSVGVCTLCGEPNWDDLRRQMSELQVAAAAPGPANAYPSTPGEFAARWNARSEEERQHFVAQLVSDSVLVQRCMLRHGAQLDPRSEAGVTAEVTVARSGGTIRVTATDVELDDSQTIEIQDTYVLITAGRCELTGTTAHANGTHVLTVKNAAGGTKRVVQ